jgi:hypothetical protein
MGPSKLASKTPANGSSTEIDLHDGNRQQTIFFGFLGCVRFRAIIESSLVFDLLQRQDRLEVNLTLSPSDT